MMEIGEYLEAWRNERNKTRKQVSNRAKQLRHNLSEAKIGRLEKGLNKVAIGEVGMIASCYEADAAVLLFFFQDNKAGSLHLTPASFTESDLITSGDDPHAKGLYNATYRLATSRLWPSDNMMAFLELGPGGHSKKEGHCHQGEEIIKVEKGPVAFWLHSDMLDRFDKTVLQTGNVIHFDSAHEHYLENECTDEEAESVRVLIIRQLIGAGREAEKPAKTAKSAPKKRRIKAKLKPAD